MKKQAKKTNKNKKESYVPSAYLRRSIAQGEKEFAEGKTKKFSSFEEMMKDLRS